MFRPCRHNLTDSLIEAREVAPTISGVCNALRATHATWPLEINERTVRVSRYGGPDRRIGWRRVYTVRVGKVPFGYINFNPYREDTHDP
jgi:hypothetical protein